MASVLRWHDGRGNNSSNVAGFLNGKLIRDDELSPDILSDVSFVPNQMPFASVGQPLRCDYCGKCSSGFECESCGAPLG